MIPRVMSGQLIKSLRERRPFAPKTTQIRQIKCKISTFYLSGNNSEIQIDHFPAKFAKNAHEKNNISLIMFHEKVRTAHSKASNENGLKKNYKIKTETENFPGLRPIVTCFTQMKVNASSKICSNR